MITVVCVLKQSKTYTVDWVRRLKIQVDENMIGPHTFVCLTDRPGEVREHGINTATLAMGWKGWWSKVELFDHFREGRFLYIDLDSLVVGNLDQMIPNEMGFWMVEDYIGADRGWKNSSVMYWHGDYSWIAGDFAESPNTWMNTFSKPALGQSLGDQGFIAHRLGDRVETFMPERAVSFKQHARKGVPDGACIVQFHGRPKPNEVKDGWVADTWRELS